MATSKTWTVVEFLENNTVEAIPSTWLYQNKSYWPPLSREKLVFEIKKCNLPNTHWPLYDVRIFKDAVYDTYELARKKARRAEDTSDLNSEVEKRRSKNVRIIYSSSSSDSEIASNKKNNNNSLAKLVIPSLPDLNRDEIVPSSNKDIEEPREEQMIGPQSISDGQTGKEQNDACNCCSKHQEKNEELLGLILKKLTVTRAQLLQLSEDISSLKIGEKTLPEPTCESFLSKFNFPLSSKEELTSLCSYLENPNNFNFAVKDLVKIGGNSSYEFVRRVLSQTITNELASQFTFHGSQTKESFSKLEVWRLLKTAASEQNPSEADHKTTEKNIKKWLRRANERKAYEANKKK